MKYGDIVVYKNQIGTVVKSENDFKFHPCNYGSWYFSELNTITDEDVRKATHEEKLELIEKEFTWGNVIKIHCIREYQIVEYIDKRDKKTYYHGYINYSDTNHSYLSLDSALIGCIGYKHEGGNGKLQCILRKWLVWNRHRNPSFHVEGVNNMNDVLEQRLAAKKRDLENQQEYFRIDMKNIEQLNYEDNAINTLLYMKKLKTEIAVLELAMQLKNTNEL